MKVRSAALALSRRIKRWRSRRSLHQSLPSLLSPFPHTGLYRSRTDMPLRAMDFESIASANSAKRPDISATEGYAKSDQRAIATDASAMPPGSGFRLVSDVRGASVRRCPPALDNAPHSL